MHLALDRFVFKYPFLDALIFISKVAKNIEKEFVNGNADMNMAIQQNIKEIYEILFQFENKVRNEDKRIVVV